MKRIWLAVMGSWMALTTGWAQEPTPQRVDDAQPVRIQFTHMGSFGDEGAKIGEEVYAPPSLVRKWGWEVATRYSDADVTIDSRTLRVSMILVRGRPMVSLSEASRAAGARTQWSPDGQTYFIRSWIRNIEQTQDGIRIDGTLPMKARAFRLLDPPRMVVDLEGADITASVLGPLPEGWRAGQMSDGVVRVVIEHPEMARQAVPSLAPGRTVSFPLLSVNSSAAPVVPSPSPNSPSNPSVPTPPKGTPAAQISGVTFTGETATEARFLLPFSKGSPGQPTGLYVSSRSLRIRIPNATLAKQESFSGGVLAPALTASPGANRSVDVTISMARPLGFEASVVPGGVSIRLFTPPNADGALAGKLIVVDPGHGGSDPGATAGGAREKDITLAVSLFLAQELEAAGAKVILTRTDDREVQLSSRPQVANQANADLFISIHVNSNKGRPVSGSKMYYHRSRPLSMLIATILDEDFKALGRIPSLKTFSDLTVAKTKGFAVLRGSQMNSVLIETGFINHPRDRAELLKADYQKQMAQAIVRSLRRYFGEQPQP